MKLPFVGKRAGGESALLVHVRSIGPRLACRDNAYAQVAGSLHAQGI
jgi:hypothetical protein